MWLKGEENKREKMNNFVQRRGTNGKEESIIFGKGCTKRIIYGGKEND